MPDYQSIAHISNSRHRPGMTRHRTRLLENQDYLKELLSYDPVSGLFTWRVDQGSARAGSVAATIATNGYLVVMVDKKHLSLHRLAFAFMGQEMPERVDHINGSRTDNRWVNLRSATAIDNARNQRLHRTNSTGLPGVMWDQRSRWRAYGYLGGRYLALGRYQSLLDAASARKSFESQNGYHTNHGK